MSRTNKDKPYWVRVNDNPDKAYVWHDHTGVGRLVYRHAVVRDENGNPVMEDRFEERTIYRIHLHRGTTKEFTSYRDYREFWEANHWEVKATSRVIKRVLVGTRRVTERVLVGETVGCDTAGLKRERDDWRMHNLNCCSAELPHWADGFSHNRPRGWEKQNHHGGARRVERDALNRYTNAYNSGDDEWLDEDELVFTRQHRHLGYWD